MGKRDHEKEGTSGKACCAIILIIAILIIVVIVVLAVTIFRVRDPQVTVQNIQVRSFSLTFLPDGPHLTFLLDIVVAVRNRNHASFKYDATTAYVYYHGQNIASAPVAAGRVKSESTSLISTEVNLDANSFLGNPNLQGDVRMGVIPLTVTSTLNGRINVASIVKRRGKSNLSCDLDVFVNTQSAGNFSCSNKLTV